jgi:hypothetical protein
MKPAEEALSAVTSLKVNGPEHCLCRREHLRGGDVRPVEVAPEEEGDLRLDPRLDVGVAAYGGARVDLHVGGEPAVQRAVDVHLLLLRGAGEAELRADDRVAGVDPRSHHGLLHEQSSVLVELHRVGQRRGARACGDGPEEPVDERLQVGAHVVTSCAACLRASSTATSMIMSSWPPTTLRRPSSSRMSA